MLAVAVVGIVSLLFVVTRLACNDFDPSRFVWAGVGNSNPARVPAGLYVHRDSGGFDGQFYYRLALGPLTDKVTDHGITLDIPSYRQQRILYPVVVWAATAGGRPRLLPWTLIAVNFAAALALAYSAARLAWLSGRSALWGIPLALAPGCAVALARDTTELVAAACAMAALLLIRNRRPVPAALVMSAAVLTRETALLVPLGVLAAGAVRLLRRQRPDIGLMGAALVPTAIFVGWQMFLRARWGVLPMFSGAGAAGSPVIGFVRTAVHDVRAGTAEKVFDLGGMLFLVLFVGAAAWVVVRSKAPDHERWAFVGAAVVLILLNPVQWDSHLGYFRAATEASLFGGLVLLGTRERLASAAMAVSALAWAATAAVSAVFL